VVENVGVAAETASKSISVQEVISTSGFMAAIFNYVERRPMLGHVSSGISESGWSKMWDSR